MPVPKIESIDDQEEKDYVAVNHDKEMSRHF
jgi:hypothetical protein